MANSSSSAFGTGESWIGRGSTALPRGLGVLGVAGVGLAGIGLSSSGTLLFSQVVGLWPGANLPAALLVGLAVCLVLVYTFAAIAAAVPRAGADYILASRVLSGPLAFVSSWVFVLFSGLLAGTLLGMFIREILPLFDQIAVLIFGTSGSQDLSRVASQPQVILSAGTVMVVLAFVALFVPQRTLIRLLWVGIGLGVVAWVVIFANFAMAPAGAFEAAWDQTHSVENHYVTVLAMARDLGFQSGAAEPNFSLMGLLLGLWIFFGFLGVAQLGGDVRKPENAILRGGWLALVAGAGIFVGAAVLVGRVIPAEWMAANAYLSLKEGPNGAATPWISYYAGLLIPSLPLLLLIFWGWVLSFVALIQAYLVFMGRVMLAWADDGLLPEGMAYVHPRFRSPLVTLLVAAVLVQVGLVVYFAGAVGSLQARFNFFGTMALLVPVIAVTFFPFLKKSWFQESPAFVRRKIGPLPLITLIGLLSLAYLIFLLVAPFLGLAGGAQLTIVDLGVFAGMVLSGIFWYIGRRLHLRARGVRLEDGLRNLPRG